MTLIEIPVQTLTDEIKALKSGDQDHDDHLFAAGAKAALLWLRDGGLPPSAIRELIE